MPVLIISLVRTYEIHRCGVETLRGGRRNTGAVVICEPGRIAVEHVPAARHLSHRFVLSVVLLHEPFYSLGIVVIISRVIWNVSGSVSRQPNTRLHRTSSNPGTRPVAVLPGA